MKILAIESSCDETSIAVVENGNNVLSNIISSQIDIHKVYGGVVPEIASRHHLKNISVVLQECLEQAKCEIEEIDAFAVTSAPGLVGALLTGVSFAKGLAYGFQKPLIPVHHMRAHIYANFIEHELELPAIALVISGGHTQIVKMTESHEFMLLGETMDDAVGECYDKVARILGLGYPGGPIIDKLSKEGKPTLTIPKTNVQGRYDFSFSGIKTHMLNYMNQCDMKGEKIDAPTVAASFQYNVVSGLIEKVILAAKSEAIDTILLAGGVAANSELRLRLGEKCLENNIQLHFPKMSYCTDNAAMVGVAAYHKYIREKNKEKFLDFLALNAISTREITQDV
ncbi:MAG: tRNA (adenosine(37)-N6)-threonylcarbamoyltransferase complex transferase subunit TsaD [Fusobacteria bacterium]|nr:tRNA (adenosine(37)-N6)-threonylcarbamoyltransferase complex transferase subunit TsaD [Fusobacteriota bacterium]